MMARMMVMPSAMMPLYVRMNETAKMAPVIAPLMAPVGAPVMAPMVVPVFFPPAPLSPWRR